MTSSLYVGAVQRVVHAEAAEIEVAPFLRRQRVLAVVEVGARVRDVPHFTADDLVHPYAHVFLALVEEHDLERQAVAAPQRMVGTKAYVAILVVIQRRELGGLFSVRRFIGSARLLARDGRDVVESERGDGPGAGDRREQ